MFYFNSETIWGPSLTSGSLFSKFNLFNDLQIKKSENGLKGDDTKQNTV